MRSTLKSVSAYKPCCDCGEEFYSHNRRKRCSKCKAKIDAERSIKKYWKKKQEAKDNEKKKAAEDKQRNMEIITAAQGIREARA